VGGPRLAILAFLFAERLRRSAYLFGCRSSVYPRNGLKTGVHASPAHATAVPTTWWWLLVSHFQNFPWSLLSASVIGRSHEERKQEIVPQA